MTDRIRAIADAVLYEGHVLWPYRRSALKNHQRWTFGGVYPGVYAQANRDRSLVACACLVEGDAPEVEVEVRFLQVVRRQVVVRGEPVDAVELNGRRHLTWDEAVERSAGPGLLEVPAGTSVEPLGEGVALVRSWERLTGLVELEQAEGRRGLHRVDLRIANGSRWPGLARGEAVRRSLMSAHAVLRVRGGAFVSLVDPPARLIDDVAACASDGLWPVLAGEPGDRSSMLAAPIVLYDHPEVAPESPGDLFDGCEIDGLLTLGILGLSDEERAEMRASDPRAREILERVEALSPADVLRLQTGAIRELRPLGES